MSVFGVLTGMAEAHAEKQKTLFEKEMERRQTLANLYLKFAMDPGTRPEAMGPMLQTGLSIMAHPPDKKLPPKYEDITPFLTTTLPAGKQTISAQETPGFQPATPTGGGMPAVPPVPGFSGIGPLAPGQSREDIPGIPALPSLPGPAAPAMPSVSLPPPPPPPAVQVSSRYTPEEMSEMAAAAAEAKMAAEYPYKAALARVEHPIQPHEIGQYGLYLPSTGQTISPPSGVSLPIEQQRWEAAAISVAQKEKVPVDWSRPVGPQLSPTLKPAVTQEYERLTKKPPDETMQVLRQMLTQKHELELEDLKARRGPEAVNTWVDKLDASQGGDPDDWWNVPNEIRTQVKVRAAQRGVAVPTRKLPTEMKNKEESADMALSAIDALSALAEANPNLIGPVFGRIGLTEQAFGASFRDPREAQIAQEMRTRMVYLLGLESKALFGGRTAHQLVEKLEKGSAGPTQDLNLLRGSITGMRWHANNVKREGAAYRFGGMQTPAGRAAAERVGGPPAAVVGGIVTSGGKRYRVVAVNPDGSVDVDPKEVK